MLRRTFGSKRDEVAGEWKRLHNEELNDLYCSPNIIRVIKLIRMRWAGHVAHIGERRGVYMVLVRVPWGKRSFGRTTRRWEDDIQINVRKVGWGYAVDLSGLGEGQVARSCVRGNVPLVSIKGREFID